MILLQVDKLIDLAAPPPAHAQQLMARVAPQY